MDKYEYKIRAEEIKTLIAKKKFTEAAKVADTIDWTRVKSVAMLCTVSDLYKVNRRFEEAKALLEMANERHPAGRMIIYSLCDITVKMGDILQAIEYYKDFVQIAPGDSGRYVLQYKIYEAQDVGLEERIAVLEELKKRDYREKWAYELAYLYHRIGLASKCVEECDELILWYGDGKYVVKAMELKMLHQPLSPAQQQKYDTFQLIKQGKEIPRNQEPEEAPGKRAASEKRDMTERRAAVNQGRAAAKNSSGKDIENETAGSPPYSGQADDGEMDIHIKPMDVGKYNTMNLQKELAKSMEELMQNGQTAQAAAAYEILRQEPQQENEAGRLPAQVPAEQYEERVLQEEAEAATDGRQGETYSTGDGEYQADVEKVMSDSSDWRISDTGELDTEEIREIHADSLVERNGQEACVEKQITGQMNIQDIMSEWEMMKKRNEEKRREEVKQRVLQETGPLFREFEETTRKGILEQMQREERLPVERRDNSALPQGVKESEAVKTPVSYRPADIDDSLAKEPTKIWDAAAVELAVSQTSAARAAAESVPAQKAPEENIPEGTLQEVYPAEPEMVQDQNVSVQEKGPAKEYAESSPIERTRENEAPRRSEPSVSEDMKPLSAVSDDVEAISEPEEQELPEIKAAPRRKEQSATGEEQQAEAPIRQAVKQNKKPPVRNSAPSPEVPDRLAGEEKPKAQARAMSKSEKKLFAAFVPTKGAGRQLIKALDMLKLEAGSGNLIITSEEGCDTATLAKNVVKDFKAKQQGFSGRLAKTNGGALNDKDPEVLFSKLADGALIVEDAGNLTRAGALKVMQALNALENGLLIILIDSRRMIRKLINENPELPAFFNATFDLVALDNATLVMYGCQYAKNLEYTIDELGKLALHTRIEDIQTIDHVVTVADVREIVDEAIAHANRKTPKHFMDILLAKRYDDDDMIILREKDFV